MSFSLERLEVGGEEDLVRVVCFPSLTRAYCNTGRRPRQKLVFSVLQLKTKEVMKRLNFIIESLRRHR